MFEGEVTVDEDEATAAVDVDVVSLAMIREVTTINREARSS
jgi:hypothetical protein